MRISSLQVFNSGLSNMQRGQTDLAKLQEQISTGKNLNRPSDDPVAATQILKFKRQLTANETFSENITVSKRRLELQEITLQQVKDAGDRIKELAIRASNGTMTNANRASIAAEVQETQKFILGLMNTKDSQGEYLFSGARGGTEPFVSDGKGGFSYQGDSEVRLIQTGPSSYVQSTDSGRSIFQTVQGDPTATALNAPANFTVTVTDPEQYQKFIDANGKADLKLELTAAGGLALFDNDGVTPVFDDAGAAVTRAALGPGDTVDLTKALGISLVMPTPLAGAGGASGNPVVSIRAEQPRHSVLSTSQALIDALKTPVTDQDSREALGELLSKAMDEVDVAQESLMTAQTQLGGRMVTLEAQNTVNEDQNIFTQAALSNLEDLDYASAIAKFSFQEVALQAAQQTFSRVNQLSLFNYL